LWTIIENFSCQQWMDWGSLLLESPRHSDHEGIYLPPVHMNRSLAFPFLPRVHLSIVIIVRYERGPQIGYVRSQQGAYGQVGRHT
jgi:hypothetical protein